MRSSIPFLAAVALLLGACGDDGDDGADRDVEATTTTAAPTTTTARPSTTTTACAPPPIGDAIAVVDLDGDGVDERWVPAGSGAAVDIVELRTVVDCEAVPVRIDGAPAQFGVGGSVLLLQGVRCEDGRVVHLGATSDDGERYTTLDLVYELRDGELVRVDDRSGELTASDPELADYAGFDC